MADPVSSTVVAPPAATVPAPITITPYYDDQMDIFDAAEQIQAEKAGVPSPPAAVVPPEPVVATPAAPVVSDGSYRRAMAWGLTPEEVQAFPNEQELIRSLNIAERAVAINSRLAPPSVAAPQQPAATPPAAVPPAPTTAAMIEEFEKGGYEPQFVNLLKAMHKESESLRSELAKTQPAIQQAQQVAQSMEQQAHARQLTEFDTRVAALGDEYTAILGKEPHDKLSPQSNEFKERGKLATKVAVLQAGYKTAGFAVPSDEELFHEAKRAMYGDRSKEAASERAKAQVAEQLRQRNGQFAGRPTGAQTPENPREEALRGIRERMKALGATVDSDNVDWTGHPSER